MKGDDFIEIGYVLNNRYEIIAKVGGGATSTVYMAKDLKLGGMWAIKVLDKVCDTFSYEKQLKEARLLAELSHIAIPRPQDFIDVETDNTMCIVMDFVNGSPLSNILEEEGAQDETKVIAWAEDICGVIGYLHKEGYVYGDIKPHNLMLSDGHIKLIDFGSLSKLGEKAPSKHYTRPYASPEQLSRKMLGAESDIYSLGITMYTLVTGKPFRAEEPCFNDVSDGMKAILYKCTREVPNDRYHSTEELANDLKHIDRYTQNVRRKMFRQLLAFTGCILLSLVFLMGSVTSYVHLGRERTLAYNELYSAGIQAEQAHDTDLAIDSYYNAILISPEEDKGYQRLFEILLPRENDPDYNMKTKDTVDYFRTNFEIKSIQNHPELMLDLAKEAVNTGDVVSSTYAVELLTHIEKSKEYKKGIINQNEVDALMIMASSNTDPDKIDIDALYQSLLSFERWNSEENSDDSSKLDNDYLLLRFYTSIAPERPEATKQIDLLAAEAENLISKNQTNDDFISNKVIPINLLLFNHYADRSLVGNDEDNNNMGLSFFIALEKANAVLDSMTYIKAGNLYRLRNDYDQATNCYENAIAEEPSNILAHIYMTQLYLDQGNKAAAGEWYAKVMTMKNESMSASTLSLLEGLKTQLE